jgi:gas vesicle protein
MPRRPTTPKKSAPAARAARSTGKTAARAGSRVGSRAADEGQRVASEAADEAQAVTSTAQEKGQEVVGVAARQAREVRATAKEQADRVRGEVVDQGRTLVEDARSQLENQANAQSRRLADSLSRLGDEVRALAEGRPQDADTVRPYVSNAADAVYDAADRLYGLAQDVEEQGLTAVLDDVQAFARRRPGAFLLGAALAGFGLGRAVRASRDDGEDQAAPGTRGRSR